ncbi:MAG TPA: GtrA family protein [Streptosporangiaceae bacterium]|nr:GtrA family protein [Streptosporangiaceae bacterium]
MTTRPGRSARSSSRWAFARRQRADVAALGPANSVCVLYARFRHLIHEGARFGVVGLVGFVVTGGGANLLRYQAGMGRLSSTAIAIVVATAITFIGSRYWTFRHRDRTGVGRETVLFFAVNGIGVGISEACVGLTYPLHLDSGLSYNVVLNGGIVLATLFRYWAYKKWVWRPGTVTPSVPARPALESLSPEEFRELLEDLADARAARQALADPGESIPLGAG